MARTSLDLCPSSPERRQAREAVAGYHEAKLGELVAHVAEAIDRFRGGELLGDVGVHGARSYECRSPARWDGRLRSGGRYTYTMAASGCTVTAT